MAGAPWVKWYWSDWRSDPRLRMCSLAARGLWAEMLALMQEAVPYGHLLIAGRSPSSAQLAALAGAPSEQIPDLIAELEAACVFSQTKEGVIYSRRMVRDERKAKIARKNGQKGGNPTLCNSEGNSSSDNPSDKGGDNTQKPEARGLEEKENTYAAEVIRLDAPAKADLAEAWDQFRRAYPRREGSHDWARAKDVFAKAVKAGVSADAIIGGAKRYLAECRRLGIEGTRFVKQARSWLNGRLWEEYTAAPATGAAVASDATDWRGVVQSFRRTGNWPFNIGPAPGRVGCRVPPEILSESGISPAGPEAGISPAAGGSAATGSGGGGALARLHVGGGR